MKFEYDSRYHLHIGYYEDLFDLECVAFKRKSENIWDVFFDFDQYGFQNLAPESELPVEGGGRKIFSIHEEELDYDLGVKRFEQWLSLQKFI